MIEKTIVVGFTGSQSGLTVLQSNKLETLIAHLKPVEAHHGGCIGADDSFHQCCLKFEIRVHLHPGCDKFGNKPKVGKWTEEDKCIVVINETKWYLERNMDIVDACNILIACPKGPEERRSGTWSTVRYAKKSKKNIIILYPDGTYESIF